MPPERFRDFFLELCEMVCQHVVKKTGDSHLVATDYMKHLLYAGITVRDSVLTNIVLLMYFCGQKELWVTTGVCPQYIRTYGNAINITASMKG